MAGINAEQIKILTMAQSVVDTVTQPRAVSSRPKQVPIHDSYMNHPVSVAMRWMQDNFIMIVLEGFMVSEIVSHVHNGMNLDKLPAAWQPKCRQLHRAETESMIKALAGVGAFGFGINSMRDGIASLFHTDYASMTLGESAKSIIGSWADFMVGATVLIVGLNVLLNGANNVMNFSGQFSRNCTEFGRKRAAKEAREAAKRASKEYADAQIKSRRSIIDTPELPELKPWQQIAILGISMASFLGTVGHPSTSALSTSLRSGLMTSSRHPSLFSSNDDGSI